MMSKIFRFKNECSLFLFLVIVGVTHWHLLFSNHTFWDGAVYEGMAASNDWYGTFAPFRDAGQPAYGLYFYLLSYLPVNYIAWIDHLVAISALAIFGWYLKKYLETFFMIPKVLVSIIAFLVTIYPATFVASSAVMTPTFTAQALLVVCGFTLSRYLLSELSSKSGSFRVHSFLFLGLAFSLNSLGFVPQWFMLLLLAILLLIKKYGTGALFRKEKVAILCIYGLFPFLVFFVNKQLFPPRNNYANYNSFKSLHVAASKFFSTYEHFLLQLTEVISYKVVSYTWIVSIIVITILFLFHLALGRESILGPAQLIRATSFQRPRYLSATLFVLTMSMAGVVPYAAVGKIPDFYRWYHRWGILFQPYLLVGILLAVVSIFALLPLHSRIKSMLVGFSIFAWIVPIFAVQQTFAIELWKRKLQEERLIYLLSDHKEVILNLRKICVYEPDKGKNIFVEYWRGYEISRFLQKAFSGSMRDWSISNDSYNTPTNSTKYKMKRVSHVDEASNCLLIQLGYSKSIANIRESVKIVVVK